MTRIWADDPGVGARVGNDAVREILQWADSLDHAIFAIGVEILPYELVGVITDSGGAMRGLRRWPLADMNVDVVVEGVAALSTFLADTSLGLDLPNPRICIGLQLGGPVEAGTVRSYSNTLDENTARKRPYRWTNVELVNLVQLATGCPTVLDNDAHAYAAYEQKLGIGQQADSFVLVLVRDGVGGAVVHERQLLALPLEFGHIPVWSQGRECDCGSYGCIESQAGRRAIRAFVAERTGLNNLDPFERAVEIADTENEQGDKALEAFRKAGESIARGLATVFTLFGSKPVVLYGPGSLIDSGRGSRAADCFMTEVERYVEYGFRAIVTRCKVVPRRLSPDYVDRGAHGAALAALNRQFFVPLETRQEHEK